MKTLFHAVAFLLLTLAAPAAEAPAPPPPSAPLSAEDFARAPLMFGATLSPDGRHYAAIVDWENDRRGIVVMNIDDAKRVGGLRGSGDMDVYRLYWHGNDRLLFQISKEDLYTHGLFSAPLSRLDDYIPIAGRNVIQVVGRPAARRDRLLAWTVNSASGPGLLNEFRVTRPYQARGTGGVASYPDLPGQALDYAADRDGELSYGVAWLDENLWLHPWAAGTRSWARPLKLDMDHLVPLATDFDPAYVWVANTDETGSHLRRLKLATGEMEPPVYSDHTFGLASAHLLFSESRRALIGVTLNRHRDKQIWFGPGYEDVQRALDERLPRDEDHWIKDVNETDTRFLIGSTGPRQPGVYHVYDRSTDRLIRVAEIAPQLPKERLNATTPVRFTSGDGLIINGYITLPAGVSKTRPAPLVVLVHGGPTARDEWRFNAEAQFLASRGYAVLQPNYRGSSDYLWPSRMKVDADFAGMRNDVIDATRSAFRSGLFDEKRVAIMGSSFGGYLALACSVEEPDLYRAAISFAGVFDWKRQLKKIAPVWQESSFGFDIWRQRLGDPATDEARFEAVSVLGRLDRLKAPVLLAHGRLDTTVNVEQTKRLVTELRERKHPHQVHYFSAASHGLGAERDRAAYFREVEAFLARHLDAPVSPGD